MNEYVVLAVISIVVTLIGWYIIQSAEKRGEVKAVPKLLKQGEPQQDGEFFVVGDDSHAMVLQVILT